MVGLWFKYPVIIILILRILLVKIVAKINLLKYRFVVKE